MSSAASPLRRSSPLFSDDLDSFLFEAPPDDSGCLCGRATYCPACGAWHPATTDQEIVEAMAESSRKPRAGRVIRKQLSV